jgi:hypothetical protein
MIETGDVVEPTPGKLKRVAAKAAAQVQDSVAMRKGRRRDQDVDLLGSEPVVLDDVAVRAQVERAKQRTPPIGRDMAGEVAERTGRAGVPFNHLGCVSGSCRGKRFDSSLSTLHRLASRRQSRASLSAMRAHRDAEWLRYVDDRRHHLKVAPPALWPCLRLQPSHRSRRPTGGGKRKILLDSVTRIS